MERRFRLEEILWLALPALVGFTVGLMTAGSLAPSAVIIGIVAYALISIFLPSLRLFPLLFAFGAHVSAVLFLYSDPIPLPLFVIERGAPGIVINVDIVQIALLYELALSLGIIQSLQNLLNTMRSRRSTVT